MNVIILNHQSLFDLALQEYGYPEAAFDLALANGMALSDELTVGDELVLPNLDEQRARDILAYYKANAITPATALTAQQKDDVIGCEGIGCWYINADFIVQ